MCFFGGGSKPEPLPPTPKKDENSAASQQAKRAGLKAKGSKENIATSPLGDPAYGENVKVATLLGQTKRA